MGVFDKIEEAEGFGSGTYFSGVGVYIVQIAYCKSDSTRDGDDFFCAEVDILDSTNPKFPPGMRVSWWVKLEDETPAMRNVRIFMAKGMGCAEKDITAAGAEMICSDQQPLAGTVMRARTKDIITKKKGNVFTVVDWEPYEGTEEQILAMRRACKLAA